MSDIAHAEIASAPSPDTSATSGSPASSKPRFDPRGLVLPVLFVAIWYAVTSLHLVNTKLIVPPVGVVTTGWHELADVNFYIGVALSLWRDLSGFVIGAVAGVAVGALIGVSRLADKLIGPTFHTARQISLFA